MLIRIEYGNSRYDIVQNYYLEALIAQRRIRRFKREEGWVEVGRDPLRNGGPGRYTGPERRAPVAHRPLGAPVRVGRQVYHPVFGGQLAVEF